MKYLVIAICIIVFFNLYMIHNRSSDPTMLLLNGKPALILLETDWCPYCKKENKELYNHKIGLPIVRINMDTDMEALRFLHSVNPELSYDAVPTMFKWNGHSIDGVLYGFHTYKEIEEMLHGK